MRGSSVAVQDDEVVNRRRNAMSNERTSRQPPNQENRASQQAAEANQRLGDKERQQQQADRQRANQEHGADTADTPVQEKIPTQDVETGTETPASRISVGPR
jgi:hypothetical protein